MDTIDLGTLIVGLAAVPSQHKAQGTPSRFVSSTYASLSEAASHTSIDLKAPAYLPRGVRLLDVSVLREPRDLAVATYEDQVRGKSLVVVMSPLDVQAKQMHLSVGDAIEEAAVGSLPAALIELRASKQQNGPGQTTLVWVKGDTVYQAIGVGIAHAELLKVAESI
jgi:hypothetical protein